MRSFEVTIEQQLGRHEVREVKLTIENCRNKRDVYSRVDSRLRKDCRIKSIKEI